MHIAAGRPVVPITAVNGSNNAPRLELHSLYGLDYKNLYLTHFLPKIQKFALQPMETSNGYN